MKRLLYCAAALATLLFAGSCQKENLESVENAQTVSYTIQLPDVINTKAQLGDDVTNVTNLYYEVWRTTDKNTTVFDSQDNHDNLLYHRKVEGAFTGGTETIEFQLINDQNFTVLFWADVPDNDIYDAGDLTNVTVSQSGSANQKKYAAFSGVDFIESTTTHLTGRTVQLKRAVAQLNIGTTPESLKQFNDLITLKQSKVTVNGLSTSFNVATQEAGTISSSVFDYASSAVPVVDSTDSLHVNGKNYAYIAMNYVGFAKAAGSTIDVTYEFTTSEGKIDNVIPNVPVKANYRTNIVGNLISSSSSYIVTLDKEWGDDNSNGNIEVLNGGIVKNINGNYEITNEEGFAYAVNKLFANGGTFYILNNLDMGGYHLGTTTLPSGKELNLLGQKPVVTRAASTGSTTGITITGLTQPLIHYVEVGATASFSNIVVDDYMGADTSAALVGENDGRVVVSGCEATDASNDEVDLVGNEDATGEVVDASDNTNGGGLAYLQHMLGTNVTNITLSSPVVIPADLTIVLDLKGKTVSHEKECTASYEMINNKGNLTITGNGKISFKDTSAGDPTFGWGSYTIRNEGTLVVENGTIEHLGEQNKGNGQPNQHMYCAIFQYSGSTTIKDGIISTPTYRSARLWKGDMTIEGGKFEGQLWVQAVDDSAKLNIKGGEFAPRGNDGSSVFVENAKYTVNFLVEGGYFETKIGCSDATKEGVKGAITGGTFTTAAKESTNAELLASGKEFTQDENGNWVVSAKQPVAKIGETEYISLISAVNAVNDGETITLINNEVFSANNYCVNNGWFEGLLYDGDKSFTIDLNGKTISNDNSKVNDYLLFFRNCGEQNKENEITIKNGTIDAGTSAYCAIATASTNEKNKKLTMNLENVKIIGNNPNGAVIKFRGGGELNVKAGTVITGKDSYVGIEAVGNNTVVNVYDGAKIYQDGTSSYVGAIIGASYNATLNIYGGEGKSAKCGIIVMSTGATINVSGGEWTANGDGTVAAGNNGVLVSQNNRYESGWACKSVLNVTGGTFKGGYDCWGSGPGQEPDDAQINIKGGNFNADPENYVVAGYEVTENAGSYTVDKPRI